MAGNWLIATLILQARNSVVFAVMVFLLTLIATAFVSAASIESVPECPGDQLYYGWARLQASKTPHFSLLCIPPCLPTCDEPNPALCGLLRCKEGCSCPWEKPIFKDNRCVTLEHGCERINCRRGMKWYGDGECIPCSVKNPTCPDEPEKPCTEECQTRKCACTAEKPFYHWTLTCKSADEVCRKWSPGAVETTPSIH